MHQVFIVIIFLNKLKFLLQSL